MTAKGPDEWQLTAPLAAPADREAITGLLEKLRAAKVKEFVADAARARPSMAWTARRA